MKTPRSTAFLLVALLAACALLGACRTAPRGRWLEVPPGALGPNPSVISTEVSVPLDGLARLVDRALPASHEGEYRPPEPARVRVSWRFRRDAPELQAREGRLVLRAVLRGELKLDWQGLRCSTSDLGAEISVATTPELDATGTLRLARPVVAVRPVGLFECLGVPLPLPELVGWTVRPLLDGLKRALGALRVPLRPVLAGALNVLGMPWTISVAGEPMCLRVEPVHLVVAPPGGEGERWTVRLGVRASPRLTLGACAGGTAPAPAKPLVRVEPLGRHFRVPLALVVPHAELERVLARDLQGRTVGQGAHKLRFGRARVGSSPDGRLQMALDVSGAISGTLTLLARPRLARDLEGSFYLELRGIEASVATQSFIERLRLAAWQVLGGSLELELRRRARLDLTERLEAARRALSLERRLDLAGVQAALRTRIHELVPAHVAIEPDRATLLFWIAGDARLSF